MDFKGIDYPKSSNFPIMLYYAKIKLYVCRILCENFIQIGQKMKKLWRIQFEYLTSSAVVILERGVTHSREGRGWGNGVMYCFFLL